MSWEVTVIEDKTSTLANVSATWTDLELGVFTYGRTSKVGPAQADAFIAEVILARDAWQAAQTENNTKSAWALARLNAADPKVT